MRHASPQAPALQLEPRLGNGMAHPRVRPLVVQGPRLMAIPPCGPSCLLAAASPSCTAAPAHLRLALQGPAAYDGISARLVERAGFDFTFMSGFCVSAARLGAPDTALLSYGEMVEQGRCMHEATRNIPIIGDGDTGGLAVCGALLGHLPERVGTTVPWCLKRGGVLRLELRQAH